MSWTCVFAPGVHRPDLPPQAADRGPASWAAGTSHHHVSWASAWRWFERTCGWNLLFLFRPLPPEELNTLIYEASGQDISIAVLTQVNLQPLPMLESGLVCDGCVVAHEGNHGVPGHVRALAARPVRRHAPPPHRPHHAGDGHGAGPQPALLR